MRRCDDVRAFQVLPRRWGGRTQLRVVDEEQAVARDYERNTKHAEAMIKVTRIRLMAAHLTGRHIELHGPIETEAARRLVEDLDSNK